MDSDFVASTALVTGAGRGIGRAIAIELAGPGTTVALLARSADQLHGVAADVRARGGTPLALPVDLADPDALAGAVDRVRDEVGPVDLLVNNAGTTGPMGPTAQVDPAAWARAAALNLVAPVLLTLAVLPAMLERERGRVVNVSSGAASAPDSMIRGNAYVTTKSALETHTLNLAAEVAGSGVTVNAFRPGAVRTSLQSDILALGPELLGAQLHTRFAQFVRSGALIGPEQAARALVHQVRGVENGRIWSVADAAP